MQKFNKIVIDFETTGFSNKDELVEIGATFIDEEGNSIMDYQSLIKTEVPMVEEVIKVHGITNSMVKGERAAKEVLSEFLSYCEDGSIFFAHNASFDMRLFFVNCLRNGLIPSKNWVFLDTLQGSKVFESQLPNKKLSTILEKRGIENKDAHRALADAKCLAKLIKIWILENSFEYVKKNCAALKLDNSDIFSSDPRFSKKKTYSNVNFYIPYLGCQVFDEKTKKFLNKDVEFLAVLNTSKKEEKFLIRDLTDGLVKSLATSEVKLPENN